MALDFTTSASDAVTITQNGSIDDLSAASYMVWHYPKSITGESQLVSKHTRKDFRLTDPRYRMDVARATTSLVIRVHTSNIGVFATNKWIFIAMVYDTAGSNADQKFWFGDLATPAVEPSPYLDQITGSGAVTSDADRDMVLGNLVSARAFDGNIAFVHITNVVLTEAQIREQQFRPHVLPSSVVFVHLGFNGTGTQADWSGNGNNGAVTNSAVIDHVPLGPLFGFGMMEAGPAAAGATFDTPVLGASMVGILGG